MEILRTPDDRFADLADYPYDPNYLMCGEYIMWTREIVT